MTPAAMQLAHVDEEAGEETNETAKEGDNAVKAKEGDEHEATEETTAAEESVKSEEADDTMEEEENVAAAAAESKEGVEQQQQNEQQQAATQTAEAGRAGGFMVGGTYVPPTGTKENVAAVKSAGETKEKAGEKHEDDDTLVIDIGNVDGFFDDVDGNDSSSRYNKAGLKRELSAKKTTAEVGL